MSDRLEDQLKAAIVRALAITTLQPADIADEAVLFGAEGLGLDSVDALEIAFEVEEAWGVQIPDDEAHRAVFTSVSTLAAWLRGQRPELAG